MKVTSRQYAVARWSKQARTRKIIASLQNFAAWAQKTLFILLLSAFAAPAICRRRQKVKTCFLPD
jgi:hypothetical protein